MKMFDLSGKVLAVEWADRDVRVSAISPGYFVTEMTRPLFDMLGMAPWIESRTPTRRLGDPDDDLRGPLLFLASDASSYVTGHNLFVDGGFDASRGAWQIPPSDFFWNKEAPQVGDTYPRHRAQRVRAGGARHPRSPLPDARRSGRGLSPRVDLGEGERGTWRA
jgi:hypothetical protein